ncbi:hypothetical protein FA95DRAFT_1122845 [Auriscalpium vulgare]|uniref:Uncharacterized protein n=1 Tax=Auriscalpium vulgare TaxID=40419 RepID=A0ACB8R5S3_9AGAM|nr:hypothetical protein FA95DRAFT_1122845 [Auriscalpium vulgare]
MVNDGRSKLGEFESSIACRLARAIVARPLVVVRTVEPLRCQAICRCARCRDASVPSASAKLVLQASRLLPDVLYTYSSHCALFYFHHIGPTLLSKREEKTAEFHRPGIDQVVTEMIFTLFRVLEIARSAARIIQAHTPRKLYRLPRNLLNPPFFAQTLAPRMLTASSSP